VTPSEHVVKEKLRDHRHRDADLPLGGEALLTHLRIDHLAWCVIDAVAEMDLSDFYAA
jgi:hypothetical protein